MSSALTQIVEAWCARQRDSYQRGQPLPVEVLLQEQPQVAASPERLLDLVYHEIRLREEAGESIQLEDYVGRFPGLADDLRNLWEVHQALGGGQVAATLPPGLLVDSTATAPTRADPTRLEFSPGSRPTPALDAVGAGQPPVLGGPPVPDGPPSSRGEARDLGDYELLEPIAKGGMGVVWKARQKSLDRIVALKVIRSGHLASPAEIARLREEAKAAGHLQHPHIVAVHQIGEAGGLHFFSMDHVDGPTLETLIRARPLSARRAAQYLAVVAEAVQYAHERGVLHRDLKPSNILIDSFDRPRITDFGLAMRIDRAASPDEVGMIVGTPSYMPPEQIDPVWGEVGPASDVYALGAVLYHLVTGRPPFRAATVSDTLTQVLDSEPAPPRLLNPALDRDVETMCLKCMEKQPRQRYATAGQVAEDLRRYLDGQPILARPLRAPARLWRFMRKHPVPSVLVVTVLALLLLIAVAGPWMAWRERLLRTVAERERRVSWSHQLVAEARLAAADSPTRSLLLSVESVLLALRRHETPLPAAEQYLRDVLAQTWGTPLPGLDGRVELLQFSPDDRWLALTVDGDHRIRLYDLSTDVTHATPHLLVGHQKQISALAFSPRGPWLISAGWDGAVRLWPIGAAPDTSLLLPGRRDSVGAIAVSEDGRWLLAAGAGNAAHLWDLDRVQKQPLPVALPGGEERTTQGAFSRDGRWLVTAAVDGAARLWDLRADPPQWSTPVVLPGHEKARFEVRFSPDSQWLVTTSSPEFDAAPSPYAARLWNLRASDPRTTCVWLSGHRGPIATVDISPDNRWLVTGSLDGTARLWDLAAADVAQAATVLPGQEGGTETTLFSPDSRRLITLGGYTKQTGSEPRVQVWDLTTSPPALSPTALRTSPQAVLKTGFDPPGRWIVTAGTEGHLALWDAHAEDPASTVVKLCGPESAIDHVACSPDGRWLVATGADRTARAWRLDRLDWQPAGRCLRADSAPVRLLTLSPDQRWLVAFDDARTGYLWEHAFEDGPAAPTLLRRQGGSIQAALFGPDGHSLFTGGDDGAVGCCDAAAPAELKLMPPGAGCQARVHDLAISRDGQWLAAGHDDGAVCVWNLRSPETAPQVLRGHRRAVLAVDLSPDGRWLASGSQDWTVRVWDLQGGPVATAAKVLEHHEAGVYAVRFLMGGRRLLSVSFDGTAQLHDLASRATSTPPLTLHEEDRSLDVLGVRPDAHCLATADAQGTVYVWDLEASDPRHGVQRLLGQPGAHTTLALSADTRWLAAGGNTGRVCLWDLHAELAEPVLLRGQGTPVVMLAFTDDGQWLTSAGADGRLQLWRMPLPDLLRAAGDLAGRNFTAAEWHQFFPSLPYRKTFDAHPAPAANEAQ